MWRSAARHMNAKKRATVLNKQADKSLVNAYKATRRGNEAARMHVCTAVALKPFKCRNVVLPHTYTHMHTLTHLMLRKQACEYLCLIRTTKNVGILLGANAGASVVGARAAYICVWMCA